MTGPALLFALACLLPWVAGTLLARRLLAPARPGALALALGAGYPLGMLLVMLLLLAWDAVGLTLAPLPLLVALTALGAAFAFFPRSAGAARQAGAAEPGGALGTAVALGLALLVAVRLGTLAAELLARPVFAWDTWMNWAPKAIVWFHERHLAPFVAPEDWLAAAPDSGVFTLGNRQASEYPPGVPLLILWHMLALGTTASSWAYLPWVLLPLSLALASWGLLRGSGAGPAVATLGAYLLVSMPLLDVHAALAGYADLWLAAYFGLALAALAHWQSGGGRGAVALLCLFALGAALVKVPGAAFALIVLGLFLARLPGWSLRTWSLLAAGTAVAVLVAFSVGVTLPLPGGVLEISRGRLSLPYLGTLELGLHPLGPILARTFLVSANWHLFWPLLAVALLARGRRLGLAALADPLLQGFILAAATLCFVFGLTAKFAEAANLVTLNRTLLYLLLPGTLIMASELAAWMRRR